MRDEDTPEFDDCLPCKSNTYALAPVRWLGENITDSGCLPCEKGAICLGGNKIEALAGHWRMRFDYVDSYEYLPDVECSLEGSVCLYPGGTILISSDWGEVMHCTSTSIGKVCARNVTRRVGTWRSSSLTSEITIRANILRCPSKSCGPNNVCLNNRTGPLCGYCSPGFAMKPEGGCSKVCEVVHSH